MVLSKGSRRLYDWLRERKKGEVFSFEEIMEVAGWSESSLTTYIKKNKIAPFLMDLKNRKMQVLLDGSDVTPQYFDETFTQSAPRPIALIPGQKLVGENQEYTLELGIGEGAIGKVWVARTDDQQRYAAKIMIPRADLFLGSRMPDIRERFRRESTYAQEFSHPNVVRYVDKGQTAKHPFLVMELAERSVADRLRDDGPILEEEAADLISNCAAGLQYIHGRGHCHRDVKPANILEFETAFKMGDMGVVRWGDFDPAVTRGGTITRAAVQIGSWNYLPPEQLESAHDVEASADVYSLGVTWIEILTGNVPSPQAVGARAYELPVLREGIKELIDGMCSYKADERPTIEHIQEVVQAAYAS